MLTKPIVGTFGPILFGVANPTDIATLDQMIDDFLVLYRTLCQVSDEKWHQYTKATDRKIRDSLWSEYNELVKEYEIMRAWLDAAKAARTFAVKGFKSSYLDGVQYIPVVEDDALPFIDFSR